MKKILSFLLLISLMLTLFCGCEESKNEASKEISTEISKEASEEISLPDEESEAEVSIDTETPGEVMEGKFGEYCFESEQDGKKVITIYSYEQITNINARREEGEWFSLTAEEMEYLIWDTKDKLDNYDIVRIRSLDGSISTYYGVSFYGSEDYYACFNGFDIGNVEESYSFDFKEELLWAMYKRIEVLNSACALAATGMDVKTRDRIVLSDAKPMTEKELNDLAEYYNDVFVHEIDKKGFEDTTGDVFYFKAVGTYISLWHTENISKGLSAKTTRMLEGNFGYSQMGTYKYDCISPNIVIELWSEETQKMVARIRIDEQTDPELISELRTRCDEFLFIQDTEQFPPTHNYRAAVYLNGFTVIGHMADIAFMYYPEGNIDQFTLVVGNPVFMEPENGKTRLGAMGCESVSEFANRMLEERLKEE